MFIIWFARRIRSHGRGRCVFGLLLGGAAGQPDRPAVPRAGFGPGHVDRLHRRSWGFPAIFNVADSCIVASMGLFLILTLRGIGLDGKRGHVRRCNTTRTTTPCSRPASTKAPPAQSRDAAEPHGDRAACPCPTGSPASASTPALAKLLGFSRTFAAEVARGRRRDASTARRSASRTGCARVLARGRTGRQGRSPRDRADRGARTSRSCYDDDDIVVIDKPVGRRGASRPWAGRARRCSARWPPPASASATSGAAERAGIVHRLDVGTSGLMVVAKSERAYTALKRAFHDREVEKIYHAVVQGHPDPLAGTIDAPIGRHPRSRLEVRGHRRRQAVASRTTRRSRRSAAPRCWRSTSRPAARTRSACTWPPSGIRASATRCTAPTRRSSARLGLDAAVAARRSGSGSGIRRPGERVDVRDRRTRPTCSTRSTCCAAD